MPKKESDFQGLKYNELFIISEQLVDTPVWPIIKKIVGHRRNALGGQMIELYNLSDPTIMARVQGEAKGQKDLIDFLSTINKYVKQTEKEKDEKSKKS